MKEAIKRKWVKALRSGRYKQGSSALKNDKGEFCCLGVLCNVMRVKWRENDWGDFIPHIEGKPVGQTMSPAGYLGNGLLRKVGMANSTQQKLAEMNDHGSTFKEIADFIQKHL